MNDQFTNDKQKERQYAGWLSGGFGADSFSVPLYSNILGKIDKYIDDSPPSKYQYPFSKLSKKIYDGAYKHFVLSMLEDGLGDVNDFENITIDELYETLCAQFYELNRAK